MTILPPLPAYDPGRHQIRSHPKGFAVVDTRPARHRVVAIYALAEWRRAENHAMALNAGTGKSEAKAS